MPPSDKTRTPLIHSRVLYHTINSCQGRSGGRNSSELTHLYLLFISDPTDERRDELLKASMAALRRIVRHYVCRCGIRPSFIAAEVFTEDAWSLAIEKLWRGMSGLHRPRQLPAWLNSVGYSAVVEEYRLRVRRFEEGPVRLEGLEKEVAGDDR